MQASAKYCNQVAGTLTRIIMIMILIIIIIIIMLTETTIHVSPVILDGG